MAGGTSVSQRGLAGHISAVCRTHLRHTAGARCGRDGAASQQSFSAARGDGHLCSRRRDRLNTHARANPPATRAMPVFRCQFLLYAPCIPCVPNTSSVSSVHQQHAPSQQYVPLTRQAPVNCCFSEAGRQPVPAAPQQERDDARRSGPSHQAVAVRPTVTPPFLRLRRDMRRCTAGPCSTGSRERCGIAATSRALDAATLARCVCVPTPAMPASAWRGSGRARLWRSSSHTPTQRAAGGLRTASRGGRGVQANGTGRTQRGAARARQGRTACIPDRSGRAGPPCERTRPSRENNTQQRAPGGIAAGRDAGEHGKEVHYRLPHILPLPASGGGPHPLGVGGMSAAAHGFLEPTRPSLPPSLSPPSLARSCLVSSTKQN